MAKKLVWIEPEASRPYSYIMDHIAKKNYNCKKCNADIISGMLYYEKKIMTPSYYFYSERYCTECYDKKYATDKDS